MKTTINIWSQRKPRNKKASAGWEKKKEQGWNKIRTWKGKPHPWANPESEPIPEPKNRLARLGGCNGPVRHIVCEGKPVKQ